MKTVYMFVGVPGSGKSTFYNNAQRVALLDAPGYVSTDAIIDHIANEFDTTYDQIFKEAIGLAQKIAEQDLKYWLSTGFNIVWDQTNLTVKGRAQKIAMIPDDWKIVAIWFPIPEKDEWKRRLDRPGKVIPARVLENMANTFTIPDTTEGFDEVYRFDAFKRKYNE